MSPFRARIRRPFVWLLIAQQILAGAGISLPSPRAVAGSVERYPCEHCGCGCQSAEQCWSHCCCYTAEQKIAWARENGVAVPEYVLAAAKREAAARPKPACSHCHRQTAQQAGGGLSRDDCARNCGKRGDRKCPSAERVSWLNALRCRGLTQQWQAAVASWPIDPHVEFCPELLPRGRVEPQPISMYVLSPLPPPTPPPNLA